jgi:hypothetical protein
VKTKQTAIYFNPELDTVRIVDEDGSEFRTFFLCTDKERIRSIKALAVGGCLLRERLWEYIAEKLPAFESLETLILVVDGKTGRAEKGSSIRVKMEDHLVKAKGRLVLQGKSKEWKLPAIKVMDTRAFKNDL